MWLECALSSVTIVYCERMHCWVIKNSGLLMGGLLSGCIVRKYWKLVLCTQKEYLPLHGVVMSIHHHHRIHITSCALMMMMYITTGS